MLLSSQHRQEETRYVNFEAQLIKTLQTGKYVKTFTFPCSKSRPLMLIVLWRNWFINTSLTKQWLMHENQKFNSLFISFGPFAFSPLVKISNIYCISRNMNIKKIKKSLHFFKGQLGIINNFIITLLISIRFSCEYQYSLNQIIIKQMRKFLRPELFCLGASIQK